MNGKTIRYRFLRAMTAVTMSAAVLVGGAAAAAPAAVAAPVQRVAAAQGYGDQTWDTLQLGVGESERLTSGLGDFVLAVGPGKKGQERIMQITLLLGPDATYMATWGATVSGAVRINGKRTGWTYNKAMRAADYNFHSSLNKYQNEGDWIHTYHRLRAGDVVDIAYTAIIPNVDRSSTQVVYRTTVQVY